MLQRCATTPSCDAAFPNLRVSFDALQSRLRHEPVTVAVADPVDARPTSVEFGLSQLSSAVRLLLYTDETSSMLPLLIHEAQANRRFDELAAQYLLIKRSAERQIAHGMQFAVVCSEDAPRWARTNVDREALASTLLGTAFIDGLDAVCRHWPPGIVDPDFHAPLASEIPAIILSGGDDPVTPAEYGARALSGFRHGKHFVLEGQGHGQISIGCMPRVVAEFVSTARVPQAPCLGKVGPTPFMLSRSATAP